MQHRPITGSLILAGLATLVMLPAGCLPIMETGGFYTRTWYPQHLLLADRNEALTHFVALETSPPGFHYSADATVVPATQLVIHTPEESVAALDITQAMLERWRFRYFDASRSTLSADEDRDRDFIILRASGGTAIPRFLTCGFRASDGKLLQFECRVDPTGIDLSRPVDPGPFSFSLGDGERFTLPVTLDEARRLFGTPEGL